MESLLITNLLRPLPLQVGFEGLRFRVSGSGLRVLGLGWKAKPCTVLWRTQNSMIVEVGIFSKFGSLLDPPPKPSCNKVE